MSDDNPDSHLNNKNWLYRLNQFLLNTPQNRDELLVLLKESHQKRLLDNEAFSMIEGVLNVSEIRVKEVMIPRSKMTVISKDETLDNVIDAVIEGAHSRFPVIGEDPSKVIGILLAKDVLAHIRQQGKNTVETIMRQACFVPESKRLNVQLKEFRTTRNHMAIVVDEYGSAAGLVTIEDVLEQIVGEIEDEYDGLETEELIIKRNKRKDSDYIIKGLTTVEEFNNYFKAQLNTSEFDTIGGLIVHKIEGLPKRGDKINLDKFHFEVVKVHKSRLHMLKLRIKPSEVKNKATALLFSKK